MFLNRATISCVIRRLELVTTTVFLAVILIDKPGEQTAKQQGDIEMTVETTHSTKKPRKEEQEMLKMTVQEEGATAVDASASGKKKGQRWSTQVQIVRI